MTLDRLALLTQLIDLLTSTVSYEERLENFVNILSRSVRVDLTLFFALDKNREKLFLTTASTKLSLEQPLEFCLGSGIVGQTAQSRRPLVAYVDEALIREANQPLEALLPDYQTLLSFPIADDNYLYGVLVLLDRDRRHLTPYDQETILIACRMLAANVRQALLHEEAKKRIAELSVLFDVAKAISSTMELEDLLNRVASISAKVINARGAALRLVDPASGQVQVSAVYGDLPPEVAAFQDLACQTVPVAGEMTCFAGEFVGADGRTQYYLGVPLQLKGNLRGMLCVFNRVSPDGRYLPFEPENRQLLQTLAGMASSSIENALAFQQIESLADKNQRMVQALTVLHDISSAFLNTIQQEKILNIMVKALTLENAMNYDRAMIFLVDKAAEELVEVRAARKQQAPAGLSLKDALLQNDNNLRRLALPELGPIRLPLSEEGGILPRSVLNRRPFHILDAEHDPRVNQEIRRLLDAKEFLCVPLLAKEEVIGVVVVDNYLTRRPLKEEDLNFLTMFANQAALAIENANLVAAIEASSRELTLIRERMLESDRLAAMSSMAEGLAHEIRNPLVSIGGFARRISKQLKENDPLRQYADVIVEEVARLEKILHQMFEYTGDALGYFQEHELNRLIEDALTLIQRDLESHKIKVVKDYSELPPVFCDDRQIKMVFYNIFQNAQQAMENGGTLTIRTFPVEKPDGLYAAVAISDTGGGIPPELVYNIFNPFFTTKEYGTGLGLSIAQRIVSRHYGDIEINNELGKGVTFTVMLPIAKYCLLPARKTPPSQE